MILQFDSVYLNEVTRLFLNVYQREPWCDEWPSYETARIYLTEFIDNPHFIGYLLLDNANVIGGCFGHKKTWWQGVEFFVDEFFIDTNEQGKGYGTLFMNHIKADLSAKGFEAITLLTERGYPAEKFYKKNGFTDKSRTVFMVSSCDE